MAQRAPRSRSVPALILAATLLAGCAQPSTTGYAPSDAALSQVVVGRDTRDTLAAIAGRPTAEGVLDGSGWYYVKSSFLQRGPQTSEVDREVVAVSFDQRGIVRNVERFGLEDGRVVVLNRRVTDRNTAGIGILRQIFGNLGNFDPGQLGAD